MNGNNHFKSQRLLKLTIFHTIWRPRMKTIFWQNVVRNLKSAPYETTEALFTTIRERNLECVGVVERTGRKRQRMIVAVPIDYCRFNDPIASLLFGKTKWRTSLNERSANVKKPSTSLDKRLSCTTGFFKRFACYLWASLVSWVYGIPTNYPALMNSKCIFIILEP